MEHLIGGSGQIGWVAVKALLLYLTAVFGFRLGERRTLAQMSPFDFVAAVAVGAIIGRVPNAEGTSYLAGAATLVTILVAHRALARLRYVPHIGRFMEHPPLVLVANGEIRDDELRRCGLTRADLYAHCGSRGWETWSRWGTRSSSRAGSCRSSAVPKETSRQLVSCAMRSPGPPKVPEALPANG
jgi:uncharacterized membrane protein YcaP (DUF421 family)